MLDPLNRADHHKLEGLVPFTNFCFSQVGTYKRCLARELLQYISTAKYQLYVLVEVVTSFAAAFVVKK